MFLLAESTCADCQMGARWTLVADDVTPSASKREEKERKREREAGSYGASDIGYTIPSLSEVVAMAHRDYVIHRGIYLRRRRQFLDTSRLLDCSLTHKSPHH